MIPAASVADEVRQAADAIRMQAGAVATPLAGLVAHLSRSQPRVVVTCARGSSAHAATFGKYLVERYLGVPVAAAAPSIVTVYRRRLALDGQLFVAVSQSGASDDIVEQAQAARAAGAITACIVNDASSPLTAACDYVLPMAAGPEHGVAATKTFVASLTAWLRLVAAWADLPDLRAATLRLPDTLADAAEAEWRPALDLLREATSLVTLGRGPTLAVAREAALKLKETCNLHAEAFSSAEFLHGPVALVDTGYPVLCFMPTDAAGAAGLRDLAADLRRKGAHVLATGDALPVAGTGHADTDAVAAILGFYGFLVHLARERGRDIDRPPHLQKVTRTR